jgi:hydrophobic/amphiphilic exporter-1 (mainly G- bacteria), HAE1 family
MNISAPFILRPVMTTLVMMAFVIFGTISYFQLPVSDLPSMDFPTITVSATLPGANADTMAAAVAAPLEKQFTNIAGIDNMSSTSAMGTTQITLQFNLDRKIDGAALDVQSAISAAQPYLPASMPTPPSFKKVNPSDAPILYIAVSSPTLPLYSVDEYAETVLAQSISMCSGVAQVQVFGSQIYSVHVQVDPEKLSVLGIGVDDVVNAVTNANVNLPTGTLFGPYKAFVVQAHGQLYKAKDYKPIIVTFRNGSPVRLGDVGNVIDSVQSDKVASWFTDTRAVILAVQRQPNVNTIDVVDRIRTILPQYVAGMPPSVNVNILYDRSVSIRASVHDVELTFLITLVLVVLVIYFFLGDARATIVASLALPVSILGTLAVLQLLHYSLDNLSLMGLTLSIGFVVDDAIVMLENIVRHREMGEDPEQASLNGSKEIGFTILSMTLSLVAVFIPILFLPGIIGRLFREFAITISAAILLSGFISISLTPMLCSRFLRTDHTDQATKGWLQRITDFIFETGLKWYSFTLRIALRFRICVLIAFFVMVGATLFVFNYVPKGFLPSEDTGQIFGMTESAQGISFDDMVRHQQQVAKIVEKNPSVAGFMSSVGAGGPNAAANGGRMFIVLKPKSRRQFKVDAIIQQLRKATAKVPGIKLYMQNLGSIKLGGQLTKAMYQFSLSSPNKDRLYDAAQKLEAKLKDMPELQDVNTDLQVSNPQVNVEIDRQKIAQLGLTVEQVEDSLNSAYSQRQVSTIYAPLNEYWVIVEVEPQYYRSPNLLHRLYIHAGTPTNIGTTTGAPTGAATSAATVAAARTTTGTTTSATTGYATTAAVGVTAGQLIPLDTVAKMTTGVGPMLINHIGQFPSVTLSFNLKPGYPLGAAVQSVKDIAKEMLPDDVTPSFQGNAQVFESSLTAMPLLLLIAVIVIYIVLGILYESYIHPITILSGLPSALLGAMIFLWACGTELTIYGFLGMILLVGIVKKNAIMIIDFALERERVEGMPPEEAIYQACLVRFRPIMMTTMAALMGSIPIAIGVGSGSESRQPLGLTVVGGLLGSQIVTLYITPVFYLYLDKLQKYAIWMFARYGPKPNTQDDEIGTTTQNPIEQP